MENIDEDIKIVEEFIRWLKIDFEYNSGNEIKAIENLLSRLKTAESENEISDQLIERQDLEIDDLKEKLKTAERMNDVLAEKLVGRINESEYCDSNIFSCFAKKEKSCKQCIKEWARKKVEDDV